MKKVQSKQKIFMLILILIFMVSLTGCGLISPGKTNQTYAEWSGDKNTSELGNGNLFVVEWEDMVGTLMSDDGYVLSSAEEATDFWWTKDSFLIPSKNNGIPTSSINTIRKVAIFMYNTVFNDEYGWGVAKPSDFVAFPDTGKSSEKPINLNPANLIKQIVEETENFLSDKNEQTANVLAGVTSAVQGLAMSILMIMWCINFVSQIVNERFTMESFLKSFMQLMLSIVVVSNSEKFTAVFVGIGNALIEHLGEVTKIGMSTLQTQMLNMLQEPIPVTSHALNVSFLNINMPLATMVSDKNATTIVVMTLVPLVAIAICTWNIFSAMTIRTFELLARITFAPIPLSFSAQNGFSHETTRYFKGIIGCAAHPALISLGVACLGSIGNMVALIFGSTASSAKGVIGVVVLSASYFLLAVYIGQTRRIADEIFAR